MKINFEVGEKITINGRELTCFSVDRRWEGNLYMDFRQTLDSRNIRYWGDDKKTPWNYYDVGSSTVKKFETLGDAVDHCRGKTIQYDAGMMDPEANR